MVHGRLLCVRVTKILFHKLFSDISYDLELESIVIEFY